MNDRKSGWGRLGWATLAIIALIVAGSKAVALVDQLGGLSMAYATIESPMALDGSRSTQQLVGTPIEQVRLGDRVAGENPIESPDVRYGPDVDPATWQQVDLRCQKRDGSQAEVSLLRPKAWLDSQQAQVGGHLWISVPECGIDGNAEVLSIGHCPPIQPGSGGVVIGTYRHHNARVIDLHVEGLDKPIGTTPNHRFWSEDRKAFVRADELRYGDRLYSPSQSLSLFVQGVSNHRDTEFVYNIETYPSHIYLISKQTVLVHNAGPEPAPGNMFLYHGTNKGPIANDAFNLLTPTRAGTPVAAEPGVYFTPDVRIAISQYATGQDGIVYRIELPVETAQRFALSEPLNSGAIQLRITDQAVLDTANKSLHAAGRTEALLGRWRQLCQ